MKYHLSGDAALDLGCLRGVWRANGRQHMQSYSEQFAVCISQVVGAEPGDLGVPVIGVLMLIAVSAVRHAFWGGRGMVVLV